jgi:ERCC4-type nuclease
MADNHVVIYCDTRERKVQDHINAEFAKPFNFAKTKGQISCEVKQLEIGDYIILLNDEPVAVIERKSLKDYGASFKDGRHVNKAKLLNFRSNSQDCKIFYIIEGPLNPQYDTEYAGIKYKNILASIQDLQICDSIFIIRTADVQQTASDLFMLCESYLRISAKPVVLQTFSGTSETGETNGEGETPPRAKLTYEEVLAKSVLTDNEKMQKNRVMAWASFPRISEMCASKIVEEFKLSNWILGTLDQAKVSSFTINGRKNNILIKLLSLKPSLEMQVNILAAMNGFSKKSALDLLTQISLEDILLNKPYSHVGLGARKTALTAARIEKIKEFLTGPP